MLAAIGSVQPLAATEAVNFTTTGETDLRIGDRPRQPHFRYRHDTLPRLYLAAAGADGARQPAGTLHPRFLGLVAWSSISGVLAVSEDGPGRMADPVCRQRPPQPHC